MPRKISFMVEDDVYENVATLAAAQPGAPSPSAFFKEKANTLAKEGRVLRERLLGKQPAKKAG